MGQVLESADVCDDPCSDIARVVSVAAIAGLALWLLLLPLCFLRLCAVIKLDCFMTMCNTFYTGSGCRQQYGLGFGNE